MPLRPEMELKERVSTIKKADSEEKMRFELYSIVTGFVLSKEIFEKNVDIQEFLNDCDPIFKTYKDYLYDNRALLLGKILREMTEQDKKFLYHFALDIKEKIMDYVNNENIISNSNVIPERENKKKDSKENKKNNYTDTLFERFKREGKTPK